jgi:hypothetical protein
MRKTGGYSINRLNHISVGVIYIATTYLGDHSNEDKWVAAIFDPEYRTAADAAGTTPQTFNRQCLRVKTSDIKTFISALESSVPD